LIRDELGLEGEDEVRSIINKSERGGEVKEDLLDRRKRRKWGGSTADWDIQVWVEEMGR
jgi:hypothetical protein